MVIPYDTYTVGPCYELEVKIGAIITADSCYQPAVIVHLHCWFVSPTGGDDGLHITASCLVVLSSGALLQDFF